MPDGSSRVKRAVDLVVSSVALALSAPVMLVVGIAIRLRMGRPVLFVQERPGLNAQPFRLYKFRTMSHEREPDGTLSADSERITKVGSFCRSWSLDELPSFWNVLRGDMSLVGPRPLLMDYLPLYTAEQARRHEVRPGLTGLAQIQGRNALDWPDRLELDRWYVDNRTTRMDIRILFMTIRKVLSREGVSAPGGATMPRFTGTEDK